MPLAADEVAVVLREAEREVSEQYECRFSLWAVPCRGHESWVTLWCRSSRWWSQVTERFLTIVVFDEGGGVSGHVGGHVRSFDFSDLATFRVALQEFLASSECGRVMSEVLDFGRRK